MGRRSSPLWRVAVAAAIVAAGAAGCSSGGNLKTFCESVRTGEDPLVLFGQYKPGDLEMGNPQLDKAVDRLQQMYDSSPTQIEESMKELLDAGKQIANALKARAPGAATGTDASALPTLNLDTDKLGQASAAVMTFAKDKCGVTLGTGSTTTTVTTLPP